MPGSHRRHAVFGPALVVVALVLAAVAVGRAAPGGRIPPPAPQSASDFTSLEKVALDELKQTKTPGAAIAIVHGDRLVLARGFGIANAETAEAVRPEMLFRLGSTTKMLTATALNVLVEEGRVKLDAPIATYLQGISAKLGQVTPHQLLTHTAGVRDEAPMLGPHDDGALGAGVRSMDDSFLFAPPGDVYSYSNPGYWIAGYLAESVAGKPYADVMQEKVFGPLGMARTTLRPTLAMTYPMAQGHSNSGEVLRPAADNAATWPAGSVFSNVLDLSRFLMAVLNNGQLEGKQVLPAPVVSRITTGHVETPGHGRPNYGYGLAIGRLRGARVLAHSGARSGYGSLIYMLPDPKVGVVVLANRSGATLSHTAMRALELVTALAPEANEPAAEPVAMSAAEMAEYVGVYSQTSKPEFEVFVKDGALHSKIDGESIAVTKLDARRLAVKRSGAAAPLELFVTRGKDGRTLYLSLGGRALKKLGGTS